MKDTVDGGWDQVRQIIRELMASRGLSQRKLAARIKVANSVISRFLSRQAQTLEIDTASKLYSLLGPDMSDMDRRTFLKVTGLLALATAVRYNPFFTVDKGEIDLVVASPEVLGTHLMAEANKVVQHSWEQAIPIYHDAEIAFRRTSAQAAFAGTMVVQLLLNLGDYEKARQQAVRIRNEYGRVLDPATDAELHRLVGSLEYYQGNYPQAVSYLIKCLQIAQEYGDDLLGQNAQHFLGRVYRDWGELRQVTGRMDEASRLFSKSLSEFDKALQIHERYGEDDQIAYDLIRKAQLFSAQGGYRDEVKRLLAEARGRYTEEQVGLHIDWEEARLDLEDGDTDMATRKAKEMLEHWKGSKYAKGISDALYILGEAQLIDLKLDQALHTLIAALCIYPYENNLRNRYLWKETIPGIYLDLDRDRRNKGSYSRLVRAIEEALGERQGVFSYLSDTYSDRTSHIEHIFSRLRNLSP